MGQNVRKMKRGGVSRNNGREGRENKDRKAGEMRGGKVGEVRGK